MRNGEKFRMYGFKAFMLSIAFFFTISGISFAQMYRHPIMSTYPWYFGTTSVNPYENFPVVSFNNVTKYQPYYGNTYTGGVFPALGDIGFMPSVKSIAGIPEIYKALQYYQYLIYANQLYQLARMNPLFYLNDIVADYPGSALNPYTIQNNLTPQDIMINLLLSSLF